MKTSNVKSTHLIFVALELVSGIGATVIGSFMLSLFSNIGSLFSSMLYSLLVIFISMLLGVILVGYFHFRKIDRLNVFGKAIAWCVFGLFLFLLMYFVLVPHHNNSLILPVVISLIGAVLGLNYTLINKRKT